MEQFGDFAISSTDHTKPFSSVIGGYAVVNNNAYYDALKDYHDMLPELSSTHQNAVKEQFLQDNYYQKHPKYFYYLSISVQLKRNWDIREL